MIDLHDGWWEVEGSSAGELASWQDQPLELRARLSAFARTSTGSSNRVCRALLVGEPPSLDAGEMTDKGSINQRAVLERRADLVTELYAPEPSPRVLVLDEGA